MSKYAIHYVDQFANSRYGNVIILGTETLNIFNKKIIKIISPTSFKNKWSSIYLENATKIPESMNINVGFYSHKNYYNILKQLGQIENLEPDTINYLEELTESSDNNKYTWYSTGYNINRDINKSQQKLF